MPRRLQQIILSPLRIWQYASALHTGRLSTYRKPRQRADTRRYARPYKRKHHRSALQQILCSCSPAKDTERRPRLQRVSPTRPSLPLVKR